jgi:excisionase family DNA binding protein
MATPPRFQSVEWVAMTFGISKRSVWRLLAAKELTAVRLGRSVRISEESVKALAARGGTAK